ncbi:MAG: tetraacyldisaccharide 4'-kinase [SAR324 cluster bacterium]|nr:tetraacyldisaccharide 4'-kinase [SAR324 cluster bacterium]
MLLKLNKILLLLLTTPLQLIYFILLSIHQTYLKIFRKSYHNQYIKIISCGNIVAGGSGKTPLVSWLIDFCIIKNLSPAVLSRGYRSIGKKPRKLIGWQDNNDWQHWGDEASLLSKRHPKVPLYIDPNRRRSAEIACFDNNNILLLDDGFQQINIKKNLDLALFDATTPLKNLKLIPTGFLREPLSALTRASAIIIGKTNLNPTNAALIKQKLQKIVPNTPFFQTKYWPVSCVDENNKAHALNIFRDTQFKAISGIGSPSSFTKALQECNFNVISHKIFADHHTYKKQELINILATNQNWITTEKDAIRLKNHLPLFAKQGCRLYFLKMDIECEDDFKKFINLTLAST